MAQLRLNPATGKLQVVGGGCGSGGSGGTFTDYVLKDYGQIINTTETNVFQNTFLANGNKLLKIVGVAKTFGVWRVYVNSISPTNMINTQTTNGIKADCDIVFWASETFNTNDILILTFEAYRYDATLLGATSETFVRVEGYV